MSAATNGPKSNIPKAQNVKKSTIPISKKGSLQGIKEANSVDDRLRQFRNYRSQVHQWIYAIDKLHASFEKQKEMALGEIFERYL